MKVLILVALFALSTYAKEIGKCQVSHWGAWSQCHPSKLCQSEIPDIEQGSYSLPAAQYDVGRVTMNRMIEKKRQHWKEQDECLAAGTCPQNVVPQSFDRANCEDGMANGYPCRNVDILKFLNFEDLGYVDRIPGDLNPRGNDIWGWTDPVADGNGVRHEYAIMGISGGTSFVRITDPENPEVLGFMYSRTSFSSWRDMKVIDNTVYCVSEAANHGMQVFDLTRLRNMPEVGKKDVPILEPDFNYAGIGNSHNIVANQETKMLYVVGATRGEYEHLCSGGLHVIDVSDRLNPKFAGCFSQDGYVHDAECVIYHGPDTRYQGHEVCFCYNENTFTLVDVTNKEAMLLISKMGYEGYAYTHQGWVTDDHTVVLLDDEQDESRSADKLTRTYIWDITDLQNPVMKRTFYSTQTAIDHNQYILNGYTYQGNYEAGLRVLWIDQEDHNLNEVAYLDVYPSRTTAAFNGAWSVYPYYDSGTVVISSINYGLFIVKPNMAAMEAQKYKVHSEKKRTRSTVSCAKGAASPGLEQFLACDNPVC